MEGIRRISQVTGAFLSNGYLSALITGATYKGNLKGMCLPFLSCFACPLAIFSCPIGTLQHFVATQQIPFLLIGGIVIVGVLVGRMLCGWVCPFGFIQDLMYKIPSPKATIPKTAEYIKYFVLIVLVLLIPFITGEPWFSKLCPYGTLTAGIPWVIIQPTMPNTGAPVIRPGDIGILFAAKLLILGGFLALFIVSKRPFCKTACPMGAIFSLFNRVSFVQLKVSEGCSSCGQCRQGCPMDLKVSEQTNHANCIRCFSCTSCSNVHVRTGGILSNPGEKPVEVEG